MKKLKLYIETSGWNFYYADDSPEKRDITIEFFDLVGKNLYDIYISDVVIREILRASEFEQKQLFALIEKYSPQEFSLTKEAEELAQSYIDRGVVPSSSWEDALHVAIATIEEMDVILSWNFKHLANIRREEKFHSVNLTEGYMKPLQIVTPMRVMNDEN